MLSTKRFELNWIGDLHAVGPEHNPESRLIGHVEILGQDFHVNLEQVTCHGHMQKGVLPDEDTYVEQIQAFCDGPGEMVIINNREYLLAITPFQL